MWTPVSTGLKESRSVTCTWTPPQPLSLYRQNVGVKKQALKHRGEEFVFVLEGRMKYRVGATEYTLGPQDSLYFDAEEEHDLEPLTKRVRYLAVFHEPPPQKGKR